MTILKLIYRNFYYYRRKNFIVFLAVILSTGILTGSLIIGDSVKYSLQNIVQSRLGNTNVAVISSTRLFQTTLAEKLSTELKIPIAPILQLKGFAGNNSNEKILQQIMICGINQNFWKLGNSNHFFNNLKDDEVIVNQTTATKLNLKVNDEILIKIERFHFVPLDAPFVPDDKNSVSIRMHISAIASENQFGNFNLQSNQIAPANIFMSMHILNKVLSLKNMANIMLIGGSNSITENIISNKIQKLWSLSDLNLRFRKIQKTNQFELCSDKIFIEDTIQKILENNETNCFPVFTYLINSFKTNNRETPYSFCSAPAQMIDSNILENEIIINEWLANDLNVKISDSVSLSYFVIGPLKKLKTDTAIFNIKMIVPIKGIASDSLLMPAFEGLANVNKCKDWEAGIPIDLKKIRPKDEAYWNIYKGTPKAFISYKTAKKIWGTKFGNCTSVRFVNTVDTGKITSDLLKKLLPKNVGIQIISVKENGTLSAKQGVDFGQLFLSLSFFLILAAVILSSIFFSLNIDSRNKELGILSALGISNRKIKLIHTLEGILIIIPGIIIGALFGILLNKIVLIFLNNIWNDIVRTSSIQMQIEFSSILLGCISSAAISVFTILYTISKKSIFPINCLKQKINIIKQSNKKAHYFAILFAVLFIISIVSIAILALLHKQIQNPMIFFGSGAFVLLVFLLFFWFFSQNFYSQKLINISLFQIAIRNIAFKRKRSFSQLCLISIAVFLLVSTGFNRTDFSNVSADRKSGTGGFLLFAETTLPVLLDLNKKNGRINFNIPDSFQNISFVQIKTTTGDDASCLNLNRVANPRIIAVNPDEFINRNAFSFSQTDKSIAQNNPWKTLNLPLGKNVFAAIADQSVITWGLGKSVGDTIKYTNEQGDTIFLKLIAGLENSIFQGNIIIAQNIFTANFPGIGGTNIFLVDCAKTDETKLLKLLENNFQNLGIAVTSTKEKLTLFQSVTNTYLDIFISLGGIALFLSIIGTAILIARNINEQKSEFAMLQALGISRKMVLKIIFMENGIILFAGIIAGTIAGVISTIPSLITNVSALPVTMIATLLMCCFLNGIFWIYLIASKTLTKNILSDLRNV